jgi:hypothetical protein
MANLNRIKVILVEKQKTGKWLAEHNWVSQHALSVNGVATPFCQI